MSRFGKGKEAKGSQSPAGDAHGTAQNILGDFMKAGAAESTRQARTPGSPLPRTEKGRTHQRSRTLMTGVTALAIVGAGIGYFGYNKFQQDEQRRATVGEARLFNALGWPVEANNGTDNRNDWHIVHLGKSENDPSGYGLRTNNPDAATTAIDGLLAVIPNNGPVAVKYDGNATLKTLRVYEQHNTLTDTYTDVTTTTTTKSCDDSVTFTDPNAFKVFVQKVNAGTEIAC